MDAKAPEGAVEKSEAGRQTLTTPESREGLPLESDTRQQKTPFERVELIEELGATPGATARNPDWTTGESMNGTTAIMAELHAGFRLIDARFDALASRLDSMGEKISCHTTCLDSAEKRISGLEDGNTSLTKRVDEMEHLLKTMAFTNEGLEARSCSNNICITGIAESTNMGHPDQFVERLLIDLYDHQSFTNSFVVMRAHLSLGPRPPPGAPPWPLVTRLLHFWDRDTAL
ncbi:hypothetical protein NDU88_006336 [Pleurodeles waltl]|uniref:Uncharacterized protein n=1 Tax=Pleurodeles waltl TaxID=8319 RepID=A0AAV7TXL2_PLEWA|nr:hypothetical protein NDU88_006336 [Pleurodeles waltl]